MLDHYNRDINYLRISVTDRCNLRCTYCMPENGINLMQRKDIMSLEDIYNTVKQSTKKGIRKVRLTGGEPLVRKGIINLVKKIASIPEVEDLSMTTNGILLSKYAKQISAAGLNRINISLDTLCPEKFKKITRGGSINDVFKGIKAAKEAGLSPIKINCVIFKNEDNSDAKEVARYCIENELEIRFIHQMNLQTGEFSIVEGGDGGNCHNCNRIRLTANGDFKPCLFDETSYSIKDSSIDLAFEKAINNKPIKGTKNMSGKFYGIGG